METMQQFQGIQFTQVLQFCLQALAIIVVSGVAMKRWLF
jgi:hypothetical protein